MRYRQSLLSSRQGFLRYTESAHMKKRQISSRFAWYREVAIAALAALALSACERTQPTPDPAPAPPTPQTLFHHVAPSVHHAVFTYPANPVFYQNQKPVTATKLMLVQS